MKINLRPLLKMTILLLLTAPAPHASSQACSSEIIPIFSAAREFFTPLAKAHHGTFRIEIDFARESSAAGAYRDPETDFLIVIDNGVLTNPRVTPDSLRMMICHEGGHFFGGTPRKPVPFEWQGPVGEDGLSLFSAEGQADYYASSECFTELITNTPTPALNLPASVIQRCNKKESTNSSSEVCQRAAQAAYDFLRMTWDFPISFETPDTSVVEFTNNSTYPSRQCRLDTFMAGALGEKRPPCWFK